jgi:hypothetical protein
MGRNSGHQWGDSMAAYGELSMATVTYDRFACTPFSEAASALPTQEARAGAVGGRALCTNRIVNAIRHPDDWIRGRTNRVVAGRPDGLSDRAGDRAPTIAIPRVARPQAQTSQHRDVAEALLGTGESKRRKRSLS